MSRAEKMLLMKQLGIIEYLICMEISQAKIAKILSFLINSSAPNIEKDLSDRHNPHAKINTKDNYESIANFFQEIGLKQLAASCQEEADKREE